MLNQLKYIVKDIKILNSLKVEPPADNAKWGTVLIQNGTKIATGLTGDMFYGR